MRSIGFGFERLGLIALSRPKTMLGLVIGVTLLAVYGAFQLKFSDDLVSVFRTPTPVYQTYNAFLEQFTDGSDAALLLVDGDLADEAHWLALERLTKEIGALEPVSDVVSVFSLTALDTAAGPPAEELDYEALLDEDWSEPAATVIETAPSEGPPAADVLVTHPLNEGRLLTKDFKTALVIITLAEGDDVIRQAYALKTGLDDLLDGLPDGMTGTLSGLPVVRAEIIRHIFEEQPLLLGLGVLVGFSLGVVLLGVLVDGVVAAATPIICMLWLYGALGLFGIPMTVLLNDLPLLVLALAFAANMHLIYSVRRDLYASGYKFKAIRHTITHIGPACALSTLTTMVAFLSFYFSGSEAIIEFGVIGALFLLGGFAAAMTVHPVTIWVALKFGWRPRPAMRGKGRAAKVLEIVSVDAAKWLDCRRLPITLGAIVVAGLAGWAHFQVGPGYSTLEDIPRASDTYEVMQRLDEDFGGAYTIHLPLPLRFDGAAADTEEALKLRDVHRAVEDALPGHYVYSPWTVVDWFGQTDRPVNRPRLEGLAESTPRGWQGLLLSEDGTIPALIVTAKDGESTALSDKAALVEAVAGRVLETDLSGQATGIVVLAARASKDIIRRLSVGLLIAAVGTAVLVGIAFRSLRIGVITVLPNILPVLAVGATLFLLGLPLQIASALAMTVALGIAVDDTVHVINSYRIQRQIRSPRAALCRTMREVGPVLVITSLVLMLGLGPAFMSWSPGIATFATFAIFTIGIALVVDLVALPALLALGVRRSDHVKLT